MVADGAKKEKGNKEVAVCGGKKVWEDDSDDDEEERAKDRKKVKAMQKGAVKEKVTESKEGGHGGEQDDWPTYLLSRLVPSVTLGRER